MKTLGIAVALLAMVLTVPSTALAQVKQLYWTTSGFFGPFPITNLIPSVPKEKARDVTIPVSMWVIEHPKGLVVFDTGNNAAISDGGCKKHWVPGNCDGLKPSQKRDDVIDRQLQKLGYSTDKVKAVVPFYGIPIGATEPDWSKLTATVSGHMAENDSFFTPDAVRALESKLRKLGKNVTLTVHPGSGHAFMATHNALGTYDAALAARIWPSAISFLRENLR